MLMPNHRSDIDWLVGYMIADRKGILGVWQDLILIVIACAFLHMAD